MSTNEDANTLANQCTETMQGTHTLMTKSEDGSHARETSYADQRFLDWVLDSCPELFNAVEGGFYVAVPKQESVGVDWSWMDDEPLSVISVGDYEDRNPELQVWNEALDYIQQSTVDTILENALAKQFKMEEARKRRQLRRKVTQNCNAEARKKKAAIQKCEAHNRHSSYLAMGRKRKRFQAGSRSPSTDYLPQDSEASSTDDTEDGTDSDDEEWGQVNAKYQPRRKVPKSVEPAKMPRVIDGTCGDLSESNFVGQEGHKFPHSPRPDKRKIRIPTHTAAEKPYKCTFKGCNWAFSNKCDLTRHIRTHTGERPYKCTFKGCNWAFSNKCDLTRHIRTHTGERPYKCTFKGCNSAFIKNSHLTVHIRAHTGERPYKCTFKGCNSAFSQNPDLTKHIRTHTGERPYKCTFKGCNSAFTQNSNLTIHIRTHTGERPHKRT